MVFLSANQLVGHTSTIPPFAGATLIPHRCCSPKTRRSTRRNHLVARNSRSDSGQEISSQSNSQSSLLSVFCPLLRLVSGGDAAAPRPRWLEVTSSGLASVARLPFGVSVGEEARSRAKDPPKALQLYEFEACPFCRCQPGPAMEVVRRNDVECFSLVLLCSYRRCHYSACRALVCYKSLWGYGNFFRPGPSFALL